MLTPYEDGAEEIITKTETVVTGKRLEQMTEAHSGNAVFEKEGVVLELNENFIEENHIKTDDRCKNRTRSG